MFLFCLQANSKNPCGPPSSLKNKCRRFAIRVACAAIAFWHVDFCQKHVDARTQARARLSERRARRCHVTHACARDARAHVRARARKSENPSPSARESQHFRKIIQSLASLQVNSKILLACAALLKSARKHFAIRVASAILLRAPFGFLNWSVGQ